MSFSGELSQLFNNKLVDYLFYVALIVVLISTTATNAVRDEIIQNEQGILDVIVHFDSWPVVDTHIVAPYFDKKLTEQVYTPERVQFDNDVNQQLQLYIRKFVQDAFVHTYETQEDSTDLAHNLYDYVREAIEQYEGYLKDGYGPRLSDDFKREFVDLFRDILRFDLKSKSNGEGGVGVRVGVGGSEVEKRNFKRSIKKKSLSLFKRFSLRDNKMDKNARYYSYCDFVHKILDPLWYLIEDSPVGFYLKWTEIIIDGKPFPELAKTYIGILKQNGIKEELKIFESLLDLLDGGTSFREAQEHN